MEIAIYAEHTVRAGERAFEPKNYAGDNWPHDSDDVIVFAGSGEELLDTALGMFHQKLSDAAGAYTNKVAKTLWEAAGGAYEISN